MVLGPINKRTRDSDPLRRLCSFIPPVFGIASAADADAADAPDATGDAAEAIGGDCKNILYLEDHFLALL